MKEAISGSAFYAIILYAVCSCSSFMSSYNPMWFTFGGTMIAAVLTQTIGTYFADMIPFVGFLPINPLKYPIYLFLLWLLNSVVLFVDLVIQCRTINGKIIKTALTNSLGGSISGTVAVLVWDILSNVLPPLKVITKILDLPIIGSFVGGLFDALILVTFNLLFGMALSRNVALAQAGCNK